MAEATQIPMPVAPPRMSRLIDMAIARGPALAAVAGLLGLWQLVVWGFEVPEYMAPSPLAVLRAFGDNAGVLWLNFWPTFLEAALGFVAGNLVAIALAVWFVHSSTAERAFFPIAVFVNTIPIIAVAPILVLIFGNGFAPKIIIAGLICFFPTLVNMVRGLKAVSPATLDLMRVLSASKSEIFWKVRLQSSLPFLFAALKIASTTCVIGAIVAEWIGSNYGLGALIIEATFNFRSPLLYATVFTAALLAVVMFALVSFAESKLVRWKSGDVH
ncbi:ABC transporter permease [Limimaricola pyoseonensis]|uniref:NitT/TauT family transport system permease protein n=1 Tax=Limimaricola pyoseonensis TaxID=521013 RepID=A0A1G7FLM8_9RHOB|nr:ABC transporter permease [Limimaricola pyoseonensis]SDE76770.1 NitT/TauT family transport system permease protein [Limimaricola pyoseonensis]